MTKTPTSSIGPIKKVIFLDVDGVLNKKVNFITSRGTDPYPLDMYCAYLLGKIQLDTDCHIVISSSWRHHKEAMEKLKDRFVNVIDKTGTSKFYKYEDRPRGHEIQTWLDAHPEVERYAILDDDSDMLDSQLPNFFQTTFDDGLTDEIAAKVTAHLNGSN